MVAGVGFSFLLHGLQTRLFSGSMALGTTGHCFSLRGPNGCGGSRGWIAAFLRGQLGTETTGALKEARRWCALGLVCKRGEAPRKGDAEEGEEGMDVV